MGDVGHSESPVGGRALARRFRLMTRMRCPLTPARTGVRASALRSAG
jgi:hypothetical protein